ncbi:MAG: DNA translocase FtsK 4TM domain-containing protein [Campylobacteraceae bacterium]|nr:DNA translocase FtsK 4TM domain-containing protein [Campylobacteraceae bacterium]
MQTVGVIGSSFADFSHNYFGYLSYAYLLFLLYPLYILNFIDYEKEKLLMKSLILVIFIFAVLIFQALVIKDNLSGEIGSIIVLSLNPFIGKAGLWIFILICFVITLLVFLEDKNISLKEKLAAVKIKKPSFDFKQIEKIPQSSKKRVKRKVEKVSVKEVGDTAEIILEETLLQEEKIQEAVIIEEKVNEVESSHSVIVEELEENKILQDQIELGENIKPKDFKLPLNKFFQDAPKMKKSKMDEDLIDKKIGDLLDKLSKFKIEGDVVRTYTGPVVTTFEFKPAAHIKVSKILNLQDDLAMALKAQTIRIQAPIPGKDVVGIEVPNEESQIIYFKDLLDSEIFQKSTSPLTMILGKDIVGKPFVTDLKKLPHLLIAGTTGSGKSVGINSMILSLLYKNSPDDLKLVMIDPKMLEFTMYEDIPHLLTPIITKPSEAVTALANMVLEMERRYTLMAKSRTKNIENYNEKSKTADYDAFPYIVVIIDELGDLMMTSGKEVEISIARLAQMARASGIHLIVATQRPSVDVVTGLIKANLPSRIAYKVGQRIDSKIILDAMGAESLLGRGDMLFTPPGMSGLVRLHAPWSKESEIEEVVEFLKAQREVQYDMNFIKAKEGSAMSSNPSDESAFDELYESAKMIVINDKKTSISYIQRKLRIGYNRAATIVEQLQLAGVLSEPNVKGNREILI